MFALVLLIGACTCLFFGWLAACLHTRIRAIEARVFSLRRFGLALVQTIVNGVIGARVVAFFLVPVDAVTPVTTYALIAGLAFDIALFGGILAHRWHRATTRARVATEPCLDVRAASETAHDAPR